MKVPIVFPMMAAVVLFIKQTGRLMACIQKEFVDRSISERDLSGGQC